MNTSHPRTVPVRFVMTAAAGLLAILLLIVLAQSALALIWDIETVDNADSGSTPGNSLALDPTTGHPRIAYYDSPSTSVKYAAWNGASWDIETVDSDGYLPSLTLDPTTGYPRISYSIHTFPWGLRYAAWNGASWDIETVDSTGYSGSNSSVALDPTTGYPRISYRDAQAARLKYASWNGASWDIEFIGTANAFETSLALDPTTGYPRISYYNQTVFKLEYAAWNGASWDITAVGDGGRFSSMKLDPTTGYPRISYQNNLTFNLEYAVWDGASWATEVVGPSSGHTSLALDPTSGYPRISTRGLTALTFSAWDGASWATENVDAGYTPSLALDSCGNPRIGYEDAVANTLKFAAAEDACAPPTTTGTIEIVKAVNVADGTVFGFTHDIEAPYTFDLSSATTLTQTFGSVPIIASYTITETDSPGWPLTNIQCSYDLSTVSTDLAGGLVVVDTLDAGDTVICTFSNTQCQPGAYDDGGNTCVPADPGHFVDTLAAIAQTQCAPGTWQDLQGQDSCKRADPGFFVPNPGATEQIECPPGTTSDQGAIECTDIIQADGFCPAQNPAVGTELTKLIGRGMGGPTRAIRNARVTIPNWRKLTDVYAQLARVEVGDLRFVRFSQPGVPVVQMDTPTSLGYQSWAVSWFGADLAPKRWARGTFFLHGSGARSPRAFVVWPTYEMAETYANVLTTFDDSTTNMVAESWFPVQTQTISLPPTQADGADVAVRVALVGVNRDNREVILTAEAGGVSVRRVIEKPTHHEALNLMTITLAGVPAGTDAVTLTLESPTVSSAHPFGGDSAAMIGASANYACEVPGP